jgi:transcriptional regulator with XRE-family HTH domain
MAKTRPRLSEQVRQAVETCGQTRYAISKATGIDQATLSRFVNGERGLPMKTLDVLADYLDLNIQAPKSKGK